MSEDSSSDNLGADAPTAEMPPTRREAGNLEVTIAPELSRSDASGQESKSPPKLEGYELIDELGRGGMGVVYRAKHMKLDRLVAIKMILAGQFASPQSIQRFALEAETAARLDHPGIVPIYEIGQSGENHFFSMKLIDGKPLSERRDEYQSDQRKCVELLVKVAEAVKHAHQRGVLHRDLKPANVLIDSSGEPLLTDLGLAKQLDNESGFTQTGLVLGTPGFMAPEQASGKSDMTVAVDIYALGAILYWLITGQAPVSGESAFEVVKRTIEEEPASLRDVRADADRDLNLICLKTLQKDPADRYSSVDDLLDDLNAWLEGEPLSVKPPNVFTATRRWIQKNFRGVAVGIVVGLISGLWMGMTILFQIVEQQFEKARSLSDQLQLTSSSWVLDRLTWIETVPDGIRESLPSWITIFAAVCGIATIGFSKPKRGDSGVSAALTASLLSGILAFVISWAWGAISNNVNRAADQDLRLLTDYFFVHPDDRGSVEAALFARYPGLEEVNSWERSGLLRAKIGIDQSLSVPGSIWTGLIVTAFVAALPLFVSSLLASVIWQREHRGWSFFWRSLEIGFYATTLLFLICRSLDGFAGAPPLWAYQASSVVIMSLAIYVALKRGAVWWRVSLFFAVMASFVANMTDSANVARSRWIAQGAKTNEQWLAVLPRLERELTWSGDRESRFRLATLYAYLEMDEAYGRECEVLLSNANFYNREIAEQAAKVALLKPTLHDDLDRAFEMADITSDQLAFNSWGYLCRTLAELRRGSFSTCVEWAEKTRDAAYSQDAWQKETVIATSFLIEALAHQALGETVKQETAIASAAELYDPESEVSFEAKLTYEILLRELNSLPDSPKSSAVQ
ncbi:MAG: serine/threonine-protein kinase [Planctomycetota bacterium]